MAIISRSISTKEITGDTVLDALNREVVPVVRMIHSAVNRDLRCSAATIGDGVTLVFDVTHSFGTEDVMVAVYDLGTQLDKISGTDYTAQRLDTGTVRLTYGVAPTSDRVLIRA